MALPDRNRVLMDQSGVRIGYRAPPISKKLPGTCHQSKASAQSTRWVAII